MLSILEQIIANNDINNATIEHICGVFTIDLLAQCSIAEYCEDTYNKLHYFTGMYKRYGNYMYLTQLKLLLKYNKILKQEFSPECFGDIDNEMIENSNFINKIRKEVR